MTTTGQAGEDELYDVIENMLEEYRTCEDASKHHDVEYNELMYDTMVSQFKQQLLDWHHQAVNRLLDELAAEKQEVIYMGNLADGATHNTEQAVPLAVIEKRRQGNE